MEKENIKCPNCNYSKDVPASKLPTMNKDIKCPSCNEFFSYSPQNKNEIPKAATPQSPQKTRDIEPELSSSSKTNIFIATVLLAATFLPISAIFSYFAKGMYGPIFKGISPAIYHLANLATSYVIAAILVHIIFKKIDLFSRIKRNHISPILFGTGNALIILYLVVRIFASSIEGGGVSYAVSILGQYPLSIARFCLGIAFIRLIIGIEVERALKKCLTN